MIYSFQVGDVVRYRAFHNAETTAGYVTHINDDMIHVYFALEQQRMCFSEYELDRGYMTWHGPLFTEEINDACRPIRKEASRTLRRHG